MANAPAPTTAKKRVLDPSEDRATWAEIFMILAAAAPVIGAVASAPMVGGSLEVLGLLDTFLLLTGIW